MSVAAGAIVLGIALGKPELVVMAAPIVGLLVVGVALHDWPDIAVDVRVNKARAVNGDVIELSSTSHRLAAFRGSSSI